MRALYDILTVTKLPKDAFLRRYPLSGACIKIGYIQRNDNQMSYKDSFKRQGLKSLILMHPIKWLKITTLNFKKTRKRTT